MKSTEETYEQAKAAFDELMAQNELLNVLERSEAAEESNMNR